MDRFFLVPARGKRGKPLDQDDRFGFPDRDDGDAAETPLRAADNHDDTSAGPLLPADVDQRQVVPAARACLLALLREGPAAMAVAAAYRGVADDGDLGLAAWARLGCLSSALHVARGAAVRVANTLAGVRRLRPVDARPSQVTDVALPPAPAPLRAVRARLLAAVRDGEVVRGGALAAVAFAAAYRGVDADGDLGLAAWARHGFLASALLLAVVIAGHPLAAARGLRPRHAVRDVLIVFLALAAALAAIHFP